MTSAPLSIAGRIASAPRYALAETMFWYAARGTPLSIVLASLSSRSSTSSPVTIATVTGMPSSRAMAITACPAANGLAAPMLVIRRAPLSLMIGSSARMRRWNWGSKPAAGSLRRRNCASAMVRSARHSRASQSSSPRSASITAASRRSPEKPAPLPMRNAELMRKLFRLDAGSLDDARPLLRFVLLKLRELLRRAGECLDARRFEELLRRLSLYRIHEQIVQTGDHRRRRFGGHVGREPERHFIA